MSLDEYQAHVEVWKAKQNRISLRTARIAAVLYQVHRAEGTTAPEVGDLIDFPQIQEE